MSNNFKVKHGLEVANGATISAGGLTVSGATTVNADFHVSGNITYNGQATVIQATPIAVDQPMIHLADGNTADTLDQGVIGKYSTTKYSGLVRDASDTGTWKLFSNLLIQPGNTVDFSAVTYDHLKIGALDATTGTFSAGVSGTTGTFSGALSATTGSFGGAVTSPNFVSTVATGTAPFTVTSATPVTGLNIGGYSSALKTASGSVVVGSATAPTSGQVLMATSGTAAAWTSLPSTDLSAATGTLAVAHGGTGVTTSTGSGANVLGTSPAITTSLTTPSTSFNLVNDTATTVNVAGAATNLHLGAGTGTTVINNNLQVAGTITYNGTANQLSPTNLSVSDSLIYMSAGNTADILDIGILGHYSTSKYSGLVRDASDAGSWKLFSNITTTPGATVDFTSATYDKLYVGNLQSNQVISTVATGTAPLVVTSATPVSGLNIDGYATALKTASGSVVVGSATAPTAGQVLTAINGTSAQWTTLTAGASDLSNVTGTLSVANGGTGATASTGTGNVVLANSPTLVTPTLGAATATSVNKVAVTVPASGATLTLADGSSLITSGANSLTLTTTGATNVTLPTAGTLITDAVSTLSSLASVGTVTTGTWSGNFGTVSGANLTNLTAANLSGTIPSTVLANSSVYLGTTAVALNRATGAMVLSGVSISGAAGALTTATGVVTVSAATAPTAGQVLTAIDGTSARWSSPGAADLSTATGTLAVANGGTGVTTKTGTGSVVLNTSPAIATSLTTGSTSFDLFNTTATTINFAGSATTLGMGAGTGTTTINNNLVVGGNITFGGGSTQLSATVLNVEDPLIYMAENNPADILDIGLYAGYTTDGTHKHTGFFRDATDGVWKIFSGITTEPDSNVIDLTGATYDDLKIGKLTTTGVNKVTITAPASSATLTLADGSSLITSGSNSITLTSTGSTNVTLPTNGTLLVDSASVNIGTSSVALNRVSGSLSLTGVDIDGSAGGLKTATGNVVVSAATAPTVGQVLIATSETTATWQTLAAGSNGTVTSVGMTVPSFLSVANSPITGSGTLAVTLSGTALPVANGGTGATTSTGSGAVVLASSPTLTTPTIGVATATSVNKVAITEPTTSATLTLADGSSLITSGANSITLTSTGATTVTLPTSGTLVASATVNTVTNRISDGDGNLRSIPQNNQTAAYTLVASDNGKNINITTGGITIPSGVFAAGDVISVYNQSGTAQNISWSGPTVYLCGTSTAKTSPLSLSARGILTIMFATTTEIVVSGNV